MPTLAGDLSNATKPAVEQLADIEMKDSSIFAGDAGAILRKVAQQARIDVSQTVAGRSATGSTQDLAYSPFPRIRALKPGFDGYRSVPPGEKIIECGELVWRLASSIPRLPLPRVVAGPDQFLALEWNDNLAGKRLLMNIYQDDDSDSGQVVIDWLMKLDSQKNDFVAFDSEVVNGLLSGYLTETYVCTA